MAARSSTVAGRMHTIFNMKSYLLNFRCETVFTKKGAKQKTPQSSENTKIKSYLQQKEEEEE
jgi:hypothetical protein